jgi:hypothetical protein
VNPIEVVLNRLANSETPTDREVLEMIHWSGAAMSSLDDNSCAIAATQDPDTGEQHITRMGDIVRMVLGL